MSARGGGRGTVGGDVPRSNHNINVGLSFIIIDVVIMYDVYDVNFLKYTYIDTIIVEFGS